MNALFARQGVKNMAGYLEAKEARREKNVAAAREVLTRNHIGYHEETDSWIRIEEDEHVVNYYPPTGEWTDHGVEPLRRGYGIRNLVRHLRGEVH
jgi:hypothetical protein